MSYPDRPVFSLNSQERRNFFATLSPVGIPLAQGDIHSVELVSDPNERLLVKKTFNKVQQQRTLAYLRTVESPALGLTQYGINVRARTFLEQAAFMERTAAAGVNSLRPVYADEQTIVMPYVPGKTLKQSLREDGNNEAIDGFLNSLYQAHRLDIVYGDRVPSNMIVQPNGEIVHIDFDYVYEGRYAKELDLAYALYPIFGLTSELDDALLRFGKWSDDELNIYDWNIVGVFMRGLHHYLTEDLQGQQSRILIPRLPLDKFT